MVTGALVRCQEWMALGRQEGEELCLTQQAIWRLLRENDQRAHASELGMLRERVRELEGQVPEWWERPWFMTMATAVGVTGVFLLLLTVMPAQ